MRLIGYYIVLCRCNAYNNGNTLINLPVDCHLPNPRLRSFVTKAWQSGVRQNYSDNKSARYQEEEEEEEDGESWVNDIVYRSTT